MYLCVNVYVHECTCNQLKAGAHCLHSNMGYTDGKSESDILIEEGDIDEDFGQIQLMKVHVTNHAHIKLHVHLPISPHVHEHSLWAHGSVAHTLCTCMCNGDINTR